MKSQTFFARKLQKTIDISHMDNYNNHIGQLSSKKDRQKGVWGDRIFEKCGIGRDEGGDGGKTLEIRGKRRLSARDGGANYQQS